MAQASAGTARVRWCSWHGPQPPHCEPVEHRGSAHRRVAGWSADRSGRSRQRVLTEPALVRWLHRSSTRATAAAIPLSKARRSCISWRRSLYGLAIAKLELSCEDDLITGTQALQHFDVRTVVEADLDGMLRGLVAVHSVRERIRLFHHHRLDWHQKGAFLALDADLR